MNKKSKEMYQKTLFDQLKTSGNNFGDGITLTRADDILMAKEVKEGMEKWLDSKSKEPFYIDTPNSFYRRYFYDLTAKEYPNLIVESQDKRMKLLNLEKEDKVIYNAKKKEELTEKFNLFYGFSRVWDLLVDCKKPLIGHNLYLDLQFVMSHFNKPLNYDYDTFKRKILKRFPVIYDNKLLA